MIAGEMSGDLLGSGLIKSLKSHYPDAVFEGIGGPKMLEAGFSSLVPMERLSVMGLVEVLGRLRELFAIRRKILEHFTLYPPDIFIGIDSPDFTIGVELRLRRQGVKTCHYVSPSVWAWRQNRIYKIARAVDLMLTLFPFEAEFYERHQVPVKFVGHPLAEIMPLNPDKRAMQSSLSLNPNGKLLAVLPGSRGGEIKMLLPTFMRTMIWLADKQPELMFVIPAVNQTRRKQIETVIQETVTESARKRLNLMVIDGQSRELMQAADAILITSGTATLEAMLAKRPMVVAYKMAGITYWLMRLMLKAKYISLPNLLADEALVPELIQHDATPERLGQALLQQLDQSKTAYLAEQFRNLHQTLQRNANEQAASAVAELIEHKR